MNDYLNELCNKAASYKNIIIYGSEQQQKFKAALEKDTGRKLTEHQLQHATNSIKKAGIYIENILDGKFIPRGAYGINHVKHNLEYGY
jgi:benzoyl-CoA reductase/2-hydroxyglutaryl-CoA dehydratase subunit BcrC/BadD/HgdB